MSKKEECPHCNGTGIIYDEFTYLLYSDPEEPLTEKDKQYMDYDFCDWCQGSGSYENKSEQNHPYHERLD